MSRKTKEHRDAKSDETPPQQPSVGRIVHYRGFPEEAVNGQDWHPAIVTRVWGGIGPLPLVNLKVLFDNGPVENRTSIEHESRDAPRAWRWPPRV